MPFVVVLSISGAVYLFKPQIERWINRDRENLAISGPMATVADQVEAAINAIPGSVPLAYELPRTESCASSVIVQETNNVVRVYVHPQTLQILHTRPEKETFIRTVHRLHGQLWMGDLGSHLVELAASWTIMMILTGLFLWWPRSAKGIGGVLYPRIGKGLRVFLRDLHAVTGVWISCFALFLLVTGLPWAKFWGSYFGSIRSLTNTAVAQQDWTVGGKPLASPKGEHIQHEPVDMTVFDRIYETVSPMNLAYPVSIAPPKLGSEEWVVKSEAQNRTLRTTIKLSGTTGEIVSRETFADRHWIDRLVAIGIAAHEGQLFGWFNQLLGLLTAIGLVVLTISGYMMWWRRRVPGTLGAPTIMCAPSTSIGLLLVMIMLGVYLPFFGLSLIIVLLLERFLISRVPSLQEWFGLSIVKSPTQTDQ